MRAAGCATSASLAPLSFGELCGEERGEELTMAFSIAAASYSASPARMPAVGGLALDLGLMAWYASGLLLLGDLGDRGDRGLGIAVGSAGPPPLAPSGLSAPSATKMSSIA